MKRDPNQAMPELAPDEVRDLMEQARRVKAGILTEIKVDLSIRHKRLRIHETHTTVCGT